MTSTKIEKRLKKPAHISQEDWDDVDSPPFTDEELKQLRPAAEVAPELVKAYKEGRIGVVGPVEGPVEIVTTLRLDEDIIEHFKAVGPDWRWRINLVLRDWVAQAKAAKTDE